MLEDILARADEVGRVRLFWGLRHERELYWLARLEALAGPRLETHVSLSAASPAWTGPRGRLPAHLLAAASAPEARKPVCYVVGNGDMIRDVRDGLMALGLDRKKQFRNEVFYPAAKPASPAAVTC